MNVDDECRIGTLDIHPRHLSSTFAIIHFFGNLTLVLTTTIAFLLPVPERPDPGAVEDERRTVGGELDGGEVAHAVEDAAGRGAERGGGQARLAVAEVQAQRQEAAIADCKKKERGE